MKITRKDFLRLTGLSFLAVGTVEAVRAVAGSKPSAEGAAPGSAAQTVR